MNYSLPDDVWSNVVFRFLHKWDLFICLHVCRLFKSVILSQHLKAVQITPLAKIKLSRQFSAHILSYSSVDLCEWALKCDIFSLSVEATEYAATIGSLDILKWLYTKRCPWNERAVDVCIQAKNWELARWLLIHHCRVFFSTWYAIVDCSEISMLEYVVKHDIPVVWEVIYTYAKTKNNTAVISWFSENIPTQTFSRKAVMEPT